MFDVGEITLKDEIIPIHEQLPKAKRSWQDFTNDVFP